MCALLFHDYHLLRASCGPFMHIEHLFVSFQVRACAKTACWASGTGYNPPRPYVRGQLSVYSPCRGVAARMPLSCAAYALRRPGRGAAAGETRPRAACPLQESRVATASRTAVTGGGQARRGWAANPRPRHSVPPFRSFRRAPTRAATCKSGGGDGASRPRATRQGPSEESKAGERQQWRMRGGTARPAQTGTLQRWGLPAREAPPQSGLLVCGHTNGREREGSGVGAATCWTTLSFEG